jgi:outer membrane receptor protein involved in Fe transport
LLNAAGPPTLRDGIIQGVTGGPDIPMPTEIAADGISTYNLIPDFHSNTVEAVVTYAPTDELSFTITPQYGESLINFRNAGGHTRDWGNIFNLQGRVTYKGMFASVNYFKAFDWNGKNGGTSLGNRSTALITTETTNRGDIDIYDFVSQIPVTASKKLDLLTGFDAKILRFVGSPPDVPQLRSRHGRFEKDDDYDVLGAYLQATYKISNDLKANAVGRFDNFSIYGSSFSPRLGFVYNPGGNKSNAIRIGLSRAFRAPSPIITNFDVVLAAQNVLGARDDITWNNTYIKYGALGLNPRDESPSLASVLQSILPRLNAADQAALAGVTLNGELTPTFSDPHTREPIAKISDQFIRKAKLESTTGIDIGFSGSAMSNRLSYSLDAFYQVQQNMLVNFTLVGPKVDFKSLDTELRTALANAGVDAALADRVVKAASAAYSAGFHAMSDQHQEDTAVALVNPFPSSGFRSFDGKAEYLGLEGSIQYAMNQGFIPYANFSWLSDVVFDPQELGEHVGSLNTYYLNSSPFRIRFGVNKAATGNKGFYGSIAARYDAEFEAQDGVWNGTVPSYFLVDASVGYQFSSGLKVGFNSTNVTDELYRSLPNMPAQRRLVFANLSYALDYNLLRK